MTTVLVVDDDPVSRYLLRHMLEREGHAVVDVGGVTEALAALAEGSENDTPPIDLIVCDYLMPERNGLDLLAEKTSRQPFVLLTGQFHRADLADDRVGEVSAYLTKPVGSEELRRVVVELLTEAASRT